VRFTVEFTVGGDERCSLLKLGRRIYYLTDIARHALEAAALAVFMLLVRDKRELLRIDTWPNKLAIFYCAFGVGEK